MLRYSFLLMATSAILMANAATPDPNRVLLNHADGTTLSVMADRVESVSFATVEGEVSLTAEIMEVNMDEKTVTVAIENTPSCIGWKYAVIPESKLSIYDTDAKLASYIGANCPYILNSSIGGGIIDVPDMKPGSQYALCCVGIDRYNTLCEVSVTKFDTPVEVTGKPWVNVTFQNTTENSFEVTMSPNDDCSSYAAVVYPLGEIERSYQSYGPQFGSTSIEDYIVNILSWMKYTGERTDTYDGLLPGTTYQVSIVPIDNDGQPAPMIAYKVKTLGGVKGHAWVDIEQTDYMLMQKPNPDNIMQIIWAPFQAFWLTPGEATVKFRSVAISEEEFNEMGIDAAKALVCADPPGNVPDDMWFRYTPCRQLFEFEPNTTGYMLAAGKNSNGEWGEVNILKFTTPETPQQNPMQLTPKMRLPLRPRR